MEIELHRKVREEEFIKLRSKELSEDIFKNIRIDVKDLKFFVLGLKNMRDT